MVTWLRVTDGVVVGGEWEMVTGDRHERERERERETETERQRQRETDRETERQRQAGRQAETEARQRQRAQRKREEERDQRERETQRETELREKERDRQTGPGRRQHGSRVTVAGAEGVENHTPLLMAVFSSGPSSAPLSLSSESSKSELKRPVVQRSHAAT